MSPTPFREEAKPYKGDLTCPHGRKPHLFTHSPVIALAFNSSPAFSVPLGLPCSLGICPEGTQYPLAELPSHPCSHTAQPSSSVEVFVTRGGETTYHTCISPPLSSLPSVLSLLPLFCCSYYLYKVDYLPGSIDT